MDEHYGGTACPIGHCRATEICPHAALAATPAADSRGLDVERLAPLIDDVYQRGMDAPEAAAYIIAALTDPDPAP